MKHKEYVKEYERVWKSMEVKFGLAQESVI